MSRIKMALQKLAMRPAVSFLGYVLGLRKARSSVTADERALLVQLARGRLRIAEIGVYEGVTSAALLACLGDGGRGWLVDPFVRATRLERWLRISYCEWIARRTVRPWRGRVEWRRTVSVDAAHKMPADVPLDFVFVDADHSYEAVRQDFESWSQLVPVGGVMAFHDSRICADRPDLHDEVGPVRLMREVQGGLFPGWRFLAGRGSVTAIERHQ